LLHTLLAPRASIRNSTSPFAGGVGAGSNTVKAISDLSHPRQLLMATAGKLMGAQFSCLLYGTLCWSRQSLAELAASLASRLLPMLSYACM
jgi:hypothetical protein